MKVLKSNTKKSLTKKQVVEELEKKYWDLDEKFDAESVYLCGSKDPYEHYLKGKIETLEEILQMLDNNFTKREHEIRIKQLVDRIQQNKKIRKIK